MHFGKPEMKTREDFYHTLAEEMYKGCDDIVRSRSHVKAMQIPSPAAKKARDKPGPGRDLRPSEYPGSTKMLRQDKHGEPYVCWNELHENADIQRSLVKSTLML